MNTVILFICFFTNAEQVLRDCYSVFAVKDRNSIFAVCSNGVTIICNLVAVADNMFAPDDCPRKHTCAWFVYSVWLNQWQIYLHIFLSLKTNIRRLNEIYNDKYTE